MASSSGAPLPAELERRYDLDIPLNALESLLASNDKLWDGTATIQYDDGEIVPADDCLFLKGTTFPCEPQVGAAQVVKLLRISLRQDLREMHASEFICSTRYSTMPETSEKEATIDGDELSIATSICIEDQEFGLAGAEGYIRGQLSEFADHVRAVLCCKAVDKIWKAIERIKTLYEENKARAAMIGGANVPPPLGNTFLAIEDITRERISVEAFTESESHEIVSNTLSYNLDGAVGIVGTFRSTISTTVVFFRKMKFVFFTVRDVNRLRILTKDIVESEFWKQLDQDKATYHDFKEREDGQIDAIVIVACQSNS